MTVTKTITVWCDHGGPQACGDWSHGPGGEPTVREVRQFLRRQGWRHVPGHPTTGPPRDLCPKHAAVSAPTTDTAQEGT